MYDLSILVPSIRKDNLNRLYNSVLESFSGNFEFIVIGPYGVPQELERLNNVLFIHDWGTPIRAQQIGLCSASGKFISYAADDGTFLPKALDIAYKTLKDLDKMNVVMGKYREGNGDTDPMMKDEYYYLSHHDSCKVKWIPTDCLMLNCGIVPRELLLEVGGWDAVTFQVCPYSYNDLAIRLYRYGVKFIIQQECMFKCSHMPGMDGDHGPIHIAQTQFDEPAFHRIYWDKRCEERIKIDLFNYKKSPAKWEMRFGK